MKLKFIILGLSLLLTCLPINAQESLIWEKTFGGEESDWGNSVIQTSDGGFVIVGSTQSFVPVTLGHIFIIKCDSNGNAIWEKYYGDIDVDEGRSVIETTNGNFMIAGYTYNTPNFWPQIYVLKLNEFGDTLWTKMYGGDEYEYGYEIVETPDSNFVIVGTTDSYGAGNYDLYLIKINDEGDTLWTRTYGSPGDDEGWSVKQTLDGGLITAGFSQIYGNQDIYLVKSESNGDTVWTKVYPAAGQDYATYVTQTADGGYIISGFSFISGSTDGFLLKTDQNGIMVWKKTFEWSGDDRAYSVREKFGGGYIYTGSKRSQGQDDVVLVSTDEMGNLLWYNTFGGTEDDYGESLAITSDSAYIITGSTASFGAGWNDVYLIKADDIPPFPFINVIKPNGGETWIQGLTATILWSSYSVSDVRIDLSTNNGLSWNNIVPSTPDVGYYFWDVSPPFESQECLIKISDVSDSSSYDVSDSIFTIKTFNPTGKIVSLNVGNKWFYDHFLLYGGEEIRIDVKEVIGDTLLPNGKTYKKIFVTSIGKEDTTMRMEYWGLDSVSLFFYSVLPIWNTGLETFYDTRIVNDTSWGNFEVSNFLSYIWGNTLTTYQRWKLTYSNLIYDRTTTAYGFGPSDIFRSGQDSSGFYYQDRLSLQGAMIDGIVYGDTSTILGISNEDIQPKNFILSQNYPNPFNPLTKIKYSVNSSQKVTLKVYDLLGREIAILVNEEKPTGEYEVEFNISNLPGGISAKGGYASGVYFYQLRAGQYVETKKMLLLK